MDKLRFEFIGRCNRLIFLYSRYKHMCNKIKKIIHTQNILINISLICGNLLVDDFKIYNILGLGYQSALMIIQSNKYFDDKIYFFKTKCNNIANIKEDIKVSITDNNTDIHKIKNDILDVEYNQKYVLPQKLIKHYYKNNPKLIVL